MSLPTLDSIRGRSAILHKLVFEMRYYYGMTYLDRCGRTINKIIREFPEWALSSDPNPQSGSLVSLANGTVFHFSGKKLDFSLERTVADRSLLNADVEAFAAQVRDLTSIVFDSLGITEYARVGFRVWHVFPCDSRDDSERWLRDLECYNVTDEFVDHFDGKREAMGVTLVLDCGDRKLRIAFNGVGRTESLDVGHTTLDVNPRELSRDQKEALKERFRQQSLSDRDCAAMIDVDAFVEEPPEIDPHEYVVSNYIFIVQRLEKSLRRNQT